MTHKSYSNGNKNKNKQIDLIKLKSFCTSKETINVMKRQSSKWEKIFANEATDEELISKIWAEYGRGYVYTIGMAD